jgi:hypothetical protein
MRSTIVSSYEDFDQALYYNQNASKNKFDPWIKATEN